MSYARGPIQRQDVRTTLRVDPTLVLRSKILELSQVELQQAVETELAENPALERLEEESEPVTEEDALRAVAPQEFRHDREDAELARSLPRDCQDAVDWVDLASSHNSLREHVRAQLALKLPPNLTRIGEYLAECLNDKGMLECPAEEIALSLNASLDDVQAAIDVLKTCEPLGVGASNVIESLILQLPKGGTLEEQLARAILAEYVDDLVARRTHRISRRFKVLPNVVEAAFQLILDLNPNPAEGFSVEPSSLMAKGSAAVTPDLILRRTDIGWEIEPRGADPSSFCVSESYRRRLGELKAKRGRDDAEFAHLNDFAQRADQFIQSLSDRRRTLRQVGAYLIEKQHGFITTGRYEFLSALTRTQLAKEMGLHESTISRATMGKFVQIATGDVVSFEVFFKPALRVQKMIEEILERENPGAPLSDEQIAKLLEKKGVFVARRTVNKYRDRTRMLNSRVRKSA